jgi:hypothetical protein
MTGATDQTPAEVLADLLGSADFPAEVLDPIGAADLILDRLQKAGFIIRKSRGFALGSE